MPSASSRSKEHHGPQPGTRAPAFQLPDSTGAIWKLSGARGRWLVLYFYPKDLSPSCTRQACDLGELIGADQAPQVVGVSPDSAQTHARFVAKSQLRVLLLADEPSRGAVPAVCALYGAWGRKQMYGRTYEGVKRTTLLIDPRGFVRARWDDVRVPGHAAAVRAQLESLTAEGEPSVGGSRLPAKKAKSSRRKR